MQQTWTGDQQKLRVLKVSIATGKVKDSDMFRKSIIAITEPTQILSMATTPAQRQSRPCIARSKFQSGTL